jgi:DNA-binding transcriptional ArsR family regulator
MVSVRKLDKQLKAMANPKRLLILKYLKKSRESVVNDIARAVELKFQATSQHLRILRSADIVRTRKKSLFVFYSLTENQEEPIKTVLKLL